MRKLILFLLTLALILPAAYAYTDATTDGTVDMRDAVKELQDGKADSAKQTMDYLTGLYTPEAVTGTVTANKTCAHSGIQVTLTAQATGGFGDLEYKFSLLGADETEIALTADFGQPSADVTIDSSMAAGTYTLQATARDAAGTETDITGGTFTILAVQDNGVFQYAVYPEGTTVVKCLTTEVTSVTVPNTLGEKTVISIGESCFEGMTNLASVVLPDTVQVIGKAAFKNCSALVSMSCE